MGLFSDIISSVGNGISDIFGGGGDNNQKKKQPQQNTPAPSPINSAVKLPAVLQAAKQSQPNPLRPVDIGNQPTQNPLMPQGPQAPAAPAIGTTNYAQPAPAGPPHTSLFGHLLHGAEDVGEGVAGVGAGAALGTLRAGEGLVQGVADIPNLAIHAGAEAGDLLTGDKNASNGIDATANRLTSDVTKPVSWLAGKTDQATGMFNHENGDQTITGKLIHDVYTPAQIAANVATVIPGATAVAAKVASLAGDSGKVGDLINAANAAAKSQSAIPTLSKVPVLGTVLAHTPGLGISKPEVSDEAAPGDKTPVEAGVKTPDEPANSPAGEKNAPPAKAPGAAETGIKPTPEPVEKPGTTPAAATPEPVTPEPAATPGAQEPHPLDKTGDDVQDLHNTTGLVKSLLQTGRNYAPDVPGNKNALQRVLDLANSHLHSNNIVSSALNKRMASALTDDEARNVRNAIETGKTTGLSDKEAAVVKSVKGNIEKPSNVTRSSLSDDYQQAKNHFPQVRSTTVRDAVKGAAKTRGLNGKISTFNDLLNQNSRFSEGSSLGKFTRAGKTVTGDANDLGLVAKKNGTFVDKAGKVYNYSRATSQELEDAGTKIQAPKDALSSYVRDTLNLKTRADAKDYLIKNSDDLGLSDKPAPGKNEVVSLKGSDGTDHSFYTDEKTAGNIKDSGVLDNLSKQTKLGTKAWNALSSVVAQGTVVNPFAHGLNLATNAAVGAGERANGITGVSTLLRGFKPIDDAAELRMSDAGVHFPTYGKNTVNAISKLTHGASKLNEATVAAIDRQARAGMFDNLTKGGASDKDAADIINKWMGGRSVYKGDNAQLGLFWNYFVRQGKNAGRLFSQAAQGHPGALINAAIAGGATYGADKGLQAATGNKGASIHAPGVVGIGSDVIKTGSQIKTALSGGAVQPLATNNPLVTHLNPIIPTAAEQILGVNQYGDKFANGSDRLANLEGITPESNLASNNGHSATEKALNTFGIYTPHIKGDAATNNPALSALNVKNAQNGSSVAFPKDFTGEQESNVANKLGNNYTTKSAAILGTQTQPQQQKYLQATSTLKKYGITDQADIQNFSKLSAKDQGSYVDAVDGLNKAGTAVSTSSVQGQLVKQGDTELAASLNKDIPTNLSQQDKNSLETYTTLGTDGQKSVWLQDNNNAANYYEANINQKQAQGALTTDDTDMSTAYSGSGGTLYVKYAVAKTNQQNSVPQSTVELYKNTTKTEYNDGDISASDSAALAKYAAQLNANGVLDKFGIGDGTSGGSSGGSSTSAEAADRAAGLPYGTISESFVKPTSDSGLKSVRATPLTQPKLEKYTPDEKSNPFVRSISVSKGIK